MLRGEHLAVTYGSRSVFEGVDISLEPGRFVALIGPNGGGKSSLLRVLAGVQQPSAGRVTRAGKAALIAPTLDPPGDLSPFDLAGYGLCAERPFWRWGLAPSDEQRIHAALVQCELEDRHGEPMGALSAGEVQRAWIAAALAAQADILIIDEPTTHLDLRFALEVLETLVRLARSGAAVVAAIHDLTLAARFADSVALLACGELVAGPPEEVLEAQALERAYGVPVSTHRHPRDGYLICLPSLQLVKGD